jgi:amino acid permease
LDKLRDIKPIVEVNDYSFYLFIVIVLISILVIIFIVYFIYKKWPKQEKYEFDLSDSKKTAYKLIEIIRDKEGSKEYIDKLHQYTYKKEVPPFDKTLFNEIIEKFNIRYLIK